MTGLFNNMWSVLVVHFVCICLQVSAANEDCIRRDEFEDRFTSLENEVLRLREDNAKLRAQQHTETQAPSRTDTLPLRNHEKRYLLGSEGNIAAAFSVTLSTTGLNNLGVNQTIHFDKVVSNYGNHYDTRLNAFTAPVQGWYVFSVTLMSRPNETQYLYVVKNGAMQFHVYSTGATYNTDSRTMVLHLAQGDEVLVQTSESAGYINNIHGYEHTSFTGFLLYPEE